MIREIVAVGIGGALGSMSRYLVSYVWLVEQSLLGFPAGTFTVNAAGSLLMGFLLEILGAGTASWLLSVGFCGGFTTFSTFSAEVVERLLAGQPTLAIGLATVHLAGSLLATYLGLLTVGATRIWS